MEIRYDIEVTYNLDDGEDAGAVGRALHQILSEQLGVVRTKVYTEHGELLVQCTTE